ncbi:vWA domain-containing protein [Alteromonas sp. H39]|uniref:vWA domain-containing protein n=1 Tax=Alteromonas sp. H39 TaxID=3389876 RepID=UPI0039E1C20E
MLIDFFFTLRKYRLKTSLRELLDLLNAMKNHVVWADTEAFYYLSRTILVKDESQFDKFDRAFADYFEGVEAIDLFGKDIPEEWLRKQIEKTLSDEEKAQLQSMGGLEQLMDTLRKRLEEQQKRHQGGNKWVGTGGTSPFGAYGDNPEGVRIGQDGNRRFSAVKVWDKREFKNLSSDVELGTRNIKMALRKLRKFARTGASEELDISRTIGETAKKGGMLDIHMSPERHNAVKVLMFFDVGGSMDPYVKSTQELFSAVHSEFKYLEYFYFHNCVYEEVWKDNHRRDRERISVWDIIHRYGPDYKVIFVGDATMGPYEITYPGGSVEHWNEEPGSVWLQRLTNHFTKAIWLNPQPQQYWPYYASIAVLRELMQERMFPLTLEGLTDGIKTLSQSR